MDRQIKLHVLPWLVLLAVPGILAACSFQERSRASVVITSVSADSPRAGDEVEVDFQVRGDGDDFTVIALPDTQHYSDRYPDIYASQVQWIVDNVQPLNIVFVTHLGDIVQNNDLDESEWQAADGFMKQLDDAGVPYGVLPGNHDMEADGTATFYQKYFPASRYEGRDWWGGSFSGNKNNYQLFSAGGDDYVILHMQYCPTEAAMEWADQVLKKYPDRKAILSTHGYLSETGERLKHCKEQSDGTVTANQMFKRLVVPHANLNLVLCGHVPTFLRLTDVVDGRNIYQLLSDYQDMENGGDGYLRIMTFQPSQDLIRVRTYSPYLGEYLTDPENEFELSYDMTGGSVPTGTVEVSRGADHCSGTVEQGSCTLTLSAGGDQPVSAVYRGDSHYLNASSPALPLSVSDR